MEIKISAQSRGTKTDARVIGWFEDGKGEASGFSPKDREKIRKILQDRGYKGSKGEDVLIPFHDGALLVVGLGKRAKLVSETLRRAGARVYAKARSEKWLTLGADASSFSDEGYPLQAFIEGLLLSSYRFDRYKSEKKNPPRLKSVELVCEGRAKKPAADALRQAKILADAVFEARTLGNEPPNVLYPDSYAQRIRALARSAGLKCQVYDEKDLARMKMGGILGVGQGSARKPRFVVLEYAGAKSGSSKPVVLVGKGITFDSGGISLKPGKDMDQMKFDMCGSAAVTGALIAASRLKLPLRVFGLLPIAENMPGGGAQRPGDVIICHNGKTVDVMNTDAEGRLILADALAYSKKLNPRCVVDIATLTGLCASFFDHLASGLMGNDPDIIRRLKEAGEKTGERVWELPSWDEYDDMIKGAYGDIQNISKSAAGTITAGKFLQHFGGHSPWAHLDIAGTAWSSSGRSYNPAGATGVGVRLFVEFLKSF